MNPGCSTSPSASTTSTSVTGDSRSATSSRCCAGCASSRAVARRSPTGSPTVGTVTDPEQTRTGSRAAYFGDEFVDTPVYDGTVLGPSATVTGPALVEEPFTVVVVPPGSQAQLDDRGNYSITRI